MRSDLEKPAGAITLAVRKGTVVAPLLLLLITAILFIIYALPSEHAKLAKRLGLEIADPTAKDIMSRAGDFFSVDNPALRNKLWKDIGNNSWTFITEILRPLLKAYLEQLADDFRLIAASVVGTVWTLALYALIPGLAGLIYRRRFLFWFLASFAILMAINASGLFPSLAGNAQPMPGSGRLLIFLLLQVALLILAFRLRRQTTSAGVIPPWLWNLALAAVLTVVGIACWQGWGPGRGDPVDGAGDQRIGFRDCPEAFCPALADIKAGSFMMGSDDPHDFPLPGAHPPRSVSVRDFFVGIFEVTHDEWDQCVKEGGCAAVEATFSRGRRPVEVSFEEANRYAAWLSKKTGKTYRLPTEAEWEYAARAGTSTRYYFGDNPDELSAYAWYSDSTARQSGGSKLHPVGRKKPNAFGLYDVYGNASEWVADCISMNYSRAPTDGSAWAPAECSGHVLRGGVHWMGNPLDLSSAKRHDTPGEIVEAGKPMPAPKSGFRLVRETSGGVLALAPEVKADGINPDADYVSRSWIWGFLGSGFPGWIYKWEFILVGLPLLYTLLRKSSAWTERKRKNIVICLDGTSNTPDQVEQGFAATTNVYKLFRMLKSDGAGMFEPGELFDASLCKRYTNGEAQQIAFYYAGVGNKYDNDPILQTLGMATGAGAGDVVERAYLDLVRVYQTGDRVFIFGFSRGSAIARLVARAIDARGAPRSVWTIKLLGKHRTLWASRKKQKVAIDVLGCWDTVGSFGIAKTIAGINFQQLNMGKDLSVPENVLQAYHMVALDEQRDSFEPTLMDPDPNRPERIVEVWFAGDHANIGGGWATDRLSDITLDFLLNRISSGYSQSAELAGQDESWGLFLKAWKADKVDYWERQDDNPHIVDPDPLGQISQWFSHLYDYRPRKLPQHAVISDTVFNRMVESLPLYAPQALFNLNDELDRRRDLIAEQVAKLQETSLLSEDDLKKVEGYKAKLRLSRFEDYWNNKILPARKGRFKLPHEALSNVAPPAAEKALA